MKKNLILIVCLYFLSSCATQRNKQSEHVVLRVMSYNMHHANPPSKSKEGLIDVEAIAKVIRLQHPDIVALQEVDVNTNRSGKINQAVLLAKMLKMNFYFAKAIDHDGGDYGVAILSRYPIADLKTFTLPKNSDPKAEQRVLAMATVKVSKNLSIRFAATHLDAQRSEENRIKQVSEINRLVEAEQLPFVIAGDLNATAGSETIRIFDESFTRTCNACGFTIPVINPNKTIDYIGFKKSNRFKVLSTEVVSEKYASDHLPVVAVLKCN